MGRLGVKVTRAELALGQIFSCLLVILSFIKGKIA